MKVFAVGGIIDRSSRCVKEYCYKVLTDSNKGHFVWTQLTLGHLGKLPFGVIAYLIQSLCNKKKYILGGKRSFETPILSISLW